MKYMQSLDEENPNQESSTNAHHTLYVGHGLPKLEQESTFMLPSL